MGTSAVHIVCVCNSKLSIGAKLRPVGMGTSAVHVVFVDNSNCKPSIGAKAFRYGFTYITYVSRLGSSSSSRAVKTISYNIHVNIYVS